MRSLKTAVAELRAADVLPAIAVFLFGATAIFLQAGGGRGGAHTVYQSISLVEATVAVLFRRRKPFWSFASILLMLAVFNYEPATIPGLLVVQYEVARRSSMRTLVAALAAAAAIIVVRRLGEQGAVGGVEQDALRLGALALSAGIGLFLRARAERHDVGRATQAVRVGPRC